jgi:hypothetical protein
MTKKFHIFIAFVLIGFFLIPNGAVYACEKEVVKSCCNKEMSSSKTEKKDCCKESNHSKNKDKDSCGGKCGHSNCTVASANYTVLFLNEIKLSNNFDFSEKKQNYFHSQTNLSSGFYSIWLIPKIS